MTEVLNLYFNCALHPFAQQEYFRKRRLIGRYDNQLSLVDEENLEEVKKATKTEGLTIIEALSCSWLMYFFKAFYDLMALYLGWSAFQIFQGDNLDLFAYQEAGQKIAIYSILLKVVLFPLFLWFYTKLWINIIKMSNHIFGDEVDIDHVAEQIVHSSLSTHIFLVIPFFGEVVQFFTSLFYIYAGLRRNLGLNKFQSLLVLLTPAFLVFLAMTLMMISIVMLILSF
ncbi:MAG: hypothetical protein GY909_03675 [Oligoflexia bacterium]|nr:hypothetical protein [Oligoflexia bacterium]